MTQGIWKNKTKDRVHFRPWGAFELLKRSTLWWVKVIFLKKNHRTSLQFHHHRSEVHIVVSGEVEFTLENNRGTHDVFIKKFGEVVVIPIRTEHRLKNVGKGSATVIEIATGNPRENDIVRIDDDYGRK